MMRRSLIAISTFGLLVLPAACGSDDDDTDITTPDVDVSVPGTVGSPSDSTMDPTMTTPMDTTMDTTMDTVGGVEGTAANGDTTTP